jgi:SAM-dependent methyltransferase
MPPQQARDRILPRVDTYALPRGPRDTRAWYRDADPMEQVDYALVDFVERHAGHTVLDLGCGLGGYSKVLAERGFEVRSFDVVPEYVERARQLGVPAELYDGERLPLPDDSVDTAILLEVIEHLEQPARLLAEARRVARKGVLVTTPNCTQSFGRVPIEFSHMLDVDHRQFFTETSLAALLDEVFGSCEVEQVAPIDRNLAGLVLPRPLRPLYRLLDRLGWTRPRYFFRLRARAPVA